MSGVRLNSNIASLIAQRSLSRASEAVAQSYLRLSTGMRINRASDDAAGLSIATSLNANARVYNRAILNINDGLSALSIAEGAMREGSNIATRLRELAVQASTGTLSLTQRRSLDTEADKLIEEFNRIAGSTVFNGRSLLQSGQGEMRIQAGFGANGSIGFEINDQLSRKQGTGEFTESTYGGGSYQYGDSVDINNDGKLDVIVRYNAGFRVRLGNGDGTFGSETVYNIGLTVGRSAIGDFNGDGKIDVMLNYAGNGYRTYTGNGDGTFTLGYTGTGIGTSFQSTSVGDFNGDGRADLVYTESGNGSLFVQFANADGSFGAAQSFTLGFTTENYSQVEVGDFNNDGHLDALLSQGVGGKVGLLYGNGNGGFSSANVVADMFNFNWTRGITSGDFNGDGLLDFAVATAQDMTMRTFLSNGNGTFTQSDSRNISTVNGANFLDAADINGDNILDILAADTAAGEVGFSYLLGNGSGTFQDRTRVNTGFIGMVAAGDFNGDGVNDILATDAGTSGTLKILLQNTYQTTSLQVVNLNTRADALYSLSIIDTFHNRLLKELGVIGAYQSRLGFARSVLESQSEQFRSAEGRIRDVDVAFESANLVRQKILQQVGASILASANQQPALALTLLKGMR